MGLSSILHTALSGISAAETTLAVVANNLANTNTPGFKQSKAIFSTQAPNTQSLGSSPNGNSVGSNPNQSGSGVQVSQIRQDFSQGSISVSNSPTDLALQGDGFFIVEGAGGQRLYTRAGQLQLNAAKELVTSGGQRVLGFTVDENFELQQTQLSPLTIPLGSAAAADDGSAAALIDFNIDADGTIRGKYSDGISRDLGQIQIASFANPQGLTERGSNLYSAGANSGLAVENSPGVNGSATIVSGSQELSNTDIGKNLIDTILAGTQIRAGLLVIDVVDETLNTLVNLRR